MNYEKDTRKENKSDSWLNLTKEQLDKLIPKDFGKLKQGLYSEEDVLKILEDYMNDHSGYFWADFENWESWFKKYKKKDKK